MLEYFTDEIIKSSSDNSEGTLLNRSAIDAVVNSLMKSGNLSKDNIDKLICDNESYSGYIVRSSDFIYVLEDYINDNSQQDEIEPIEKDLDAVDFLYGDWHSECGDR